MKLITFTLEGYRRFVEPTSVKLHADMVALLGPNEAGKSSVLKALGHLNSDGRFGTNELPRRSDARPLLKWQLQLEDDDKAALEALPEAGSLERITITKGDDGLRRWSFFPNLERDRTPRGAAATSLVSDAADLQKTLVQYGLDIERDLPTDLLASTEEYSGEELAQLANFGARVADLIVTVPAGEAESSFLERGEAVQQTIRVLVDTEQLPHPTETARAILEPRVPQIRLFEVADRDLQREYDLNEVAAAPPPALRHLCTVADLDLIGLRDDIASGQIADASSRRNEANRRLVEVFETWNQEEIALQFEFQGSLLLIQATTPSDNGLSPIDDRSEGMRWFAALLAFTHGAGNGPILLADEIETHLHYDAQADLLEVLSRQSLISKVIYTTHSFGCLPYDIGSGVRVVQQTGPGTSRLANGFWESGSGFSPLLASMGAAAVSFTPTRRAVVGEGPTEAILLPTLLRQASGLKKLDFQVAPGLASVAASEVRNLETEAGQVAYLVDGDAGGQRNRRKLLGTVPESRIVSLQDPLDGSPMETEDLIDGDEYVKAVFEELRVWNSDVPDFDVSGLPQSMRTKAIETWCKRHHISPPDKAAVAQRLANRAGTHQIFESRRHQYLTTLLSALAEAISYTPEGHGPL